MLDARRAAGTPQLAFSQWKVKKKGPYQFSPISTGHIRCPSMAVNKDTECCQVDGAFKELLNMLQPFEKGEIKKGFELDLCVVDIAIGFLNLHAEQYRQVFRDSILRETNFNNSPRREKLIYRRKLTVVKRRREFD